MGGMDKLEQSLLNAKRFMEHDAFKASTPKSSMPSIREPEIVEPIMAHQIPNMNINESSIPSAVPQMTMAPKSQITTESILNSKLPDAIKQVMLDTPIPDPIPDNTLSPQFINEVSKKMNSQEYSVNNMRATANSNARKESIDPIPTLIPETHTINSSSLKETIKECLKEILEEENLIIESKNLKENLQLRVGNKVFTGTIKNVKTIKK